MKNLRNGVSEFLDFWWPLIVAIILFSLLVAGVTALVYSLSKWECSKYGSTTGRHTEYVFPNGCFIEHDGELLHWDEFKYRRGAYDGLKLNAEK